ncbi:MAG: SPOR domain-containing protein [Clostridia bacterium]|nr:SPOR domain-containing protein [Clostridia bacterium]
MEYKRNRNSSARRRRRKRYSSSRSRSGSGAPKALFAVLLTCGIVYLLSASAAGTWIAQNLAAPIFEAFNKKDTVKDDDSLAVSLSTAKNAVTTDVTLPGISVYSLQMGIYSSEENASSQATALKAQGAAGYVFKDSEQFRVLGAGYLTESDAKTVKDRLINEGTDCTLFTITCNDEVFKISTDKDNTEAVESAFSAFKEATASLSNAILTFDSDSQSIADGQYACKTILEDFEKDMELFESDVPDQLKDMVNCRNEYKALLSNLSSASCSSRSEFASSMKYAQLHMADLYISLSASLSAST